MTGRTRSLTPYKELRDFFTFLYEDRIGYAYSPTKEPVTKEWTENFFEWPGQERELINHVLQTQATLEVYVSPALFSTASNLREHFLGSNVVWCDFDYGIPSSETVSSLNLPAPSRRIRSSTPGHEHWYWKLDYFETNPENLEDFNKRSVYSLDGDLGTWNANRVLRPPRTTHHESGKEVTQIVRENTQTSILPFMALDMPPVGASEYDTEIDLDGMPEAMSLVAAYKWPPKAFELFRRKEHKDRSSSLCALAYYCTEMGMEDLEVMSILFAADDSWGPFKGRSDRVRLLNGILNRARLRYPLLNAKQETENDFISYSFGQFLTSNVTFNWAIEGLVQQHGLALVAAQPGVGKTQLTLRAAICASIGKPFLKWDIPEPRKTAFFSLEMGHADLLKFLQQMASTLTPQELGLLDTNFRVIPMGESIYLEREAHQAKLMRYLSLHPATGIFIDSLSHALEKSPNDDEGIQKTFDFLRGRVIKDLDAFVWFVHHDRKPQVGNKKPNTLADVYGSQFIERDMTTGINMWKVNPDDPHSEIEISCTKLRMATQFETFLVKRDTEDLSFKIVSGSSNGKAATGGRKKNASEPGGNTGDRLRFPDDRNRAGLDFRP